MEMMQNNKKNALFKKESDNQISSCVLIILIRHQPVSDRAGLYAADYLNLGGSGLVPQLEVSRLTGT